MCPNQAARALLHACEAAGGPRLEQHGADGVFRRARAAETGGAAAPPPSRSRRSVVSPSEDRGRLAGCWRGDCRLVHGHLRALRFVYDLARASHLMFFSYRVSSHTGDALSYASARNIARFYWSVGQSGERPGQQPSSCEAGAGRQPRTGSSCPLRHSMRLSVLALRRAVCALALAGDDVLDGLLATLSGNGDDGGGSEAALAALAALVGVTPGGHVRNRGLSILRAALR